MTSSEPTDADALRALAWLRRGKPEADVRPDDIAPAQTPAELAEFRKASLRRADRPG